MTIKELQSKIEDFSMKNDLSTNPEYRILDVMSELGEVAKEMLKMTDYGKKPLKYREEIRSELGDLLFSVITIANSLDVDLEEALDVVLAKYAKRLMKGDPGSQND